MDDDKLILKIRVQPRASRNRLMLQPDGSLKAYVTAPPVDGAASRALIELLQKCLRLSRHQIEIVAGERSREKKVEISGMAASEVKSRLASADRKKREP